MERGGGRRREEEEKGRIRDFKHQHGACSLAILSELTVEPGCLSLGNVQPKVFLWTIL